MRKVEKIEPFGHSEAPKNIFFRTKFAYFSRPAETDPYGKNTFQKGASRTSQDGQGLKDLGYMSKIKAKTNRANLKKPAK